MRFTFPNGEHPGLELTRGTLSIGSDPDDTVCLPAAGLKPAHARIELQPERRLCALRLAPGALAYVNARPVRSLALLRAGDLLTLNRDLYNLYHILNHFNLFGGGYGSQANGMIHRLLKDC